ncbi:hypothetical protein POM88_034252 [Heracleum sosnowskyi]|uniref:F-box associated beta-propeller type 3 domain-containing protein n=1 Tax=Heracleum sosnowskyi TaxID=360622 RepID=A0AAD8MAD9_9APIA|nr:hypothetical protein POM88_034252 [Heracleum sosnowskyi]
MIECNTRGVILGGPQGEFYLADVDSLGDDSASVVELDGPLNTLLYGATFVGSANGIVCAEKDNMNELWLCNSSTRKARKIPSAPSEFPNSSYEFSCGFGYDYVNDDCKVLKIAHDDLRGIISIMLCSTKTNNWARIQNVPSNITCVGSSGICCASGSLYFDATKNHNLYIIIGFDFGLQQFKEVPLPSVYGTSVEFTGGWSRKHVLLELDNGKVVWNDIERKTLQNLKIRGVPTEVDLCLYNESLLQLTDDNLVQKSSQDKHHKQKKRKARKIPSPPSRFLNSYYLICCGFGYDYVNDDYKILKIALDYPYFIIGIVLYSIKTNKWTWIHDVPRNITRMFTTEGISASGYLYFMAQNNLSSDIILGFNFGLQQFEEFPYPNGTAVGSCSRWIDSFEGSLSLVECYSNSDSHSCMDVWVLNHSREDNNWFKAFSLELPRGFGCFGPVALSRSKKDILFVMNKEKLKWYDIGRKTFQNVKIRGIPTGAKPYVYIKSLLQLTEDDLLQKPLHDKQNR